MRRTCILFLRLLHESQSQKATLLRLRAYTSSRHSAHDTKARAEPVGAMDGRSDFYQYTSGRWLQVPVLVLESTLLTLQQVQ